MNTRTIAAVIVVRGVRLMTISFKIAAPTRRAAWRFGLLRAADCAGSAIECREDHPAGDAVPKHRELAHGVPTADVVHGHFPTQRPGREINGGDVGGTCRERRRADD